MAEGVKDVDESGVIDGGAADVEPDPDPEIAPLGWTKDKSAPTGWRPRKRAGRSGRRAVKAEKADEGGKLSESDDGRDPEPSWHSPKAAKAPYEASVKERNEVAALLAVFYSIPADFLLTVDPYCFGALNANLESIIDATTPIICRSETVVKYVTGASGLILWIKLMAALKPVFVAIFQHHVIHSVELVADEEGMPVAQHSDFSAYSAA